MRGLTVLFVIAGLVCMGCTGPSVRPGVISIYAQPSVNVERAPDIDFTAYSDFAVATWAEVTNGQSTAPSPITEKQLLFIARNCFESLGYTYTDDASMADFLLTVNYSNDYKTQYIPPSTSTIPWYVPGQTQTSTVNLYGSHGSSWGTVTSTTPGYYVPMTVTRPGYIAGAYYPTLVVGAIDCASKKPAWVGTCVAATPESDIRISAKPLLRVMLEKDGDLTFPAHQRLTLQDADPDAGNGAFGAGLDIITFDGNSFYPIISQILVGSPADSAKLRVYDVVKAIDGKSTLNLPFSSCMAALDKNAGDVISLAIDRNGKTLTFDLIAEDEQIARERPLKIRTADASGRIVTIRPAANK